MITQPHAPPILAVGIFPFALWASVNCNLTPHLPPLNFLDSVQQLAKYQVNYEGQT